MTKYSTGGAGGGDEGDACELCGREGANVSRATVAGAELLVCSDCEPHGTSPDRGGRSGSSGGGDGTADGSGGDPRDMDERDRRKKAAQNTAKVLDAATGDSRHWEEEGTDYEDDRLPYLVSDYGDRVETARQDAGLTVEELADAVDADEDDVLAVEQGRATRADVGGSLIRRLEEELDVTLVDE